MLPTIKQGQNNDYVKVAKYLIKYSKRNEAVGMFDADFLNYVCTWQGNNGLEVDGIIGKASWTKIAELAPTCSTSKNKTSPYTCAVQILVGGITVDGVYGPKTKKAVAAYQSANKLSADGICGPKTWKSLIVGATSTSTGTTNTTTSQAGQSVVNGKLLNNCVFYLQWDSKWKNIKYSTHTSKQTIGNSGCGPSAMAMIMATFIDKKYTPIEMCKLAVDNGFRTYDNGTDWDFFKFCFNKYAGFSKFVQTKSVPTLKSALKEGALAVCSMNGNDDHFWTTGG